MPLLLLQHPKGLGAGATSPPSAELSSAQSKRLSFARDPAHPAPVNSHVRGCWGHHVGLLPWRHPKGPPKKHPRQPSPSQGRSLS